jgi:hypothetical protein
LKYCSGNDLPQKPCKLFSNGGLSPKIHRFWVFDIPQSPHKQIPHCVGNDGQCTIKKGKMGGNSVGFADAIPSHFPYLFGMIGSHSEWNGVE